MATSNAYLKVLKKRLVQDFVKINLRSPTPDELDDLLADALVIYSHLDEAGFSSVDIVTPQFMEESSAAAENKNRRALINDFEAISTKLDDITNLLEDGFRGFASGAERTKRFLSRIEHRADNLILFNKKTDVFIEGIEETFDDQKNIIFASTTASVEAGYVTLGRKAYDRVDLAGATISVRALGQDILGTQQTSGRDSLKEEDGNLWEYLAFKKSNTGRVTAVIDISLEEPTNLSEVRLAGVPLNVNKHTTCTVRYSVDGQLFTVVEPGEIVFEKNELTFTLGIADVRTIQVLLSKEAADNRTTRNNQWVYAFILDTVELYTNEYTSSMRSEMIAGPYLVRDVEGNDVNFYKAKCSACVTADAETSVNLFVSKDNVTYLPISHTSTGPDQIVTFGNSENTGTEIFVDLTVDPVELVEEPAVLDQINTLDTAVINTGISQTWTSRVPLESIMIKRNVPSTGLKIDRLDSGWFYDEVNNQYQTTVFIDKPEGTYIDLGSTSAFINGALTTGRILLRAGYSVFVTNDSNYVPVESGLTTYDDLTLADPLYPYNHKYLIEGYTYGTGYNGERVYPGLGEYFGKLLSFVGTEVFESSGVDLSIYTIDETTQDFIFKVKVDKSMDNWLGERYEIDWSVRRSDSNTLYVKAILATSSTSRTPVLDSFKIRVI